MSIVYNNVMYVQCAAIKNCTRNDCKTITLCNKSDNALDNDDDISLRVRAMGARAKRDLTGTESRCGGLNNHLLSVLRTCVLGFMYTPLPDAH